MKTIRQLTLGALVLVALCVPAAFAATPASGTLSTGTPALSWDGFPGPAYMDDAVNPLGTSTGDAGCTDGKNCDTYTLHIAAGDYTGKRVHFSATWTNPADDYDVYVHPASNSGPVTAKSAGSPPSTIEENTFDLGLVVTGVNDTYTVHVVYFTVGALDAYHGSVSLEAVPTVPVRTPKFVTGNKSHLRFTKSRALYANGTTSGSEPNSRVDFMGNAYVGSIRGLTAGDDIWRLDLNPSSPTFDPFLHSARASIDANGNISNPTYKGQPDSTAPDNINTARTPSDGGGDMDIAVGYAAPSAGASPIVATTSLVAANISAQRSTDRAESFIRNPDGNITVPEDDRNWMDFYGGNVVYLAYREFTGLVATSKFYVNRSEDGGLTYGPAVLAAVGGNTTGNVAVDQNDGTVYFCYQGTKANQVMVTVGTPAAPGLTPIVYTAHVAATGTGATVAALFPCVKVGGDGTVYVAYSDAGAAIYIAHSTDHGQTWSVPVRVSNLTSPSQALFPWMAAGKASGSVAVAWFGAESGDTEDGAGLNNDAANWKVFFAQTTDATAQNPTFYTAVASDHYVHGSNISLGGFGGAANRNLGDFFQIDLDPQGLALFAFSDDSNDFSGSAYVIHQIDGLSMHTGRRVNLGQDKDTDTIDPSQPQVVDQVHDAQLRLYTPSIIATDNPVDIVNIRYGCEQSGGKALLTATMKLSGLTTVPPTGIWRMHFASNPTRAGLSDRADQWFLEASADAQGNPIFKWGTGTRTSGGGLTYTAASTPADAGSFDTTNKTVTVKVDVAKLNALATRGPIVAGTTLVGLRGSARAAQTVTTSAASATVGTLDITRGGTSYTVPSACFAPLP
jgi:hypothetical protein